ncbi:MAG: beta-ketoacyl synthase chain length factor [Betaproteobacteria bacterium]|nr:beta-ketoacyl synthase chain length factor [Betaproteobacteria bacterium]
MNAATLSAHVEGIGLLGPGLDNWPAGRRILLGETPYAPQPTALSAPASLPPSERRRASRAIKLALALGHESIAAALLDPATLATVFSSSAGDGYNCHEICQALATSDRQISPTRFHNSVHNAPAGYWGIASGAMVSSSVICAYDASFGAGLLEALAQVVADDTRCVLVSYDTDYPEPLRAIRPVPDAFGIALVLAPQPGPHALARISAGLTGDAAARLADPALESLRQSIPAARGLPLLQAIARGDAKRVVLDYLDEQRLAVDVTPCG